MRVAVTADLQFDTYQNLSHLTSQGVTSRLLDMVSCFDWIVDHSVKAGCTKLVVVGDIFDDRISIDLSVLDQVCRCFSRASNKLELHVVAGNHDAYLRSTRINSLQVFRGIAKLWDASGVDGILGFLPWCDDVELLKSNASHVADLGAKYLFAHATVKGSVHSEAGGIDPLVLCPGRFKRVILGDVHSPVEVMPKMQYVGSPMQLDFSDAGSKRGFRILDTTSDTFQFVENEASPRFHVVKGSVIPVFKPRDFVRVKTDDPDVAKNVMAIAHEQGCRAETTYVESMDAPPRCDIRSSQDHASILEAYCAFKGMGKVPALIKVGLELLEKARV